jgi:multidrug resistance protein MdtO
LRKLHRFAGLMNQRRRIAVASVSLIDEIRRLTLLLVAWLRIEDNTRDALAPATAFCRAAERALRTGEVPRVEPAAIAATGTAWPLADAISRTLREIAEILTAPPSAAVPAEAGDAARSARRLLAADAFSDPEHVRFALKLTMDVMTCYFIESLADWPGIGTCVPTCFMVALGTVGETLHKATLRIVGALFGAGLGLGAILLLMPRMTSLGDLFLLLAPVTLLAAWIASGTERIAYAGVQIGLAFYLVVLHGTGPTVDMYTARDRADS